MKIVYQIRNGKWIEKTMTLLEMQQRAEVLRTAEGNRQKAAWTQGGDSTFEDRAELEAINRGIVAAELANNEEC